MSLKLRIFLGLLGFLLVSVVYAATSYRVNKTACVMVNEHSSCFDVSNPSCAYDMFIPTNTAGEWTAFRTNKPACITVWTACNKNCTY